MNGAKPSFVYLLGPARSGTTPLMFLLCDHPQLVVWPQEFPFFTEYNRFLPKNTDEYPFSRLLELVQSRLDEFKQQFSPNLFSVMDYSNVPYDALMAAIKKRYRPRVSKENFLRILLDSFREVVYPDRDPEQITHYVVTTKTGGIEWDDKSFIERSRFLFLIRHPWRCYAAYKSAFVEKEMEGQLAPFSYPRFYFYHNLKSLSHSSKIHSANRLCPNFYFLGLEELRKDPQKSMRGVAAFLGIPFQDVLLQLTCVGKPFRGHFAQQELNVGEIVDKESSYPELADHEKYLLSTLLTKEVLHRYGIPKGKFRFPIFAKKLVTDLRRIPLKGIKKFLCGMYLLRGLLKLRLRILLDSWKHAQTQ